MSAVLPSWRTGGRRKGCQPVTPASTPTAAAERSATPGPGGWGPRLGPAEATKWRRSGAAPPTTWPYCRWRCASSQAPSEDEDPDEEIEDEAGEAGGADEHHTGDEESDEDDDALAGFWRGKDQAEDGAT
jgi:hypothetical protein